MSRGGTLDSNWGLLIYSKVLFHWATPPLKILEVNTGGEIVLPDGGGGGGGEVRGNMADNSTPVI